MKGGTIPINYTSYITQLQSIANGTIAVNITRSCSILKSVFINFDKAVDTKAGGTNPSYYLDLEDQAKKKMWNSFYHPMQNGNRVQQDGRGAGNYAYDQDKELQFQLLVGNKQFPIFPARTSAEQYYQLKKSIGIHGSAFHSISIDTLAKYTRDHYIIGIDTEKVLGASFSGINCRQDLIKIGRAHV